MLKGELFSTDMVRAYLEGRKKHTARPIVPQPVCYGPNVTFKAHRDDFFLSAEKGWLRCRTCGHDPQYSREGVDVSHHYKPKYRPGDFMYCRETWTCMRDIETGHCDYFYAANKKDYDTVSTTYLCDDDGFDTGKPFPWHPSIHMPKSIARLFFRVTRVEVMRLEDVTEEFAIEDGFQRDSHGTAAAYFKGFWLDTYGEDAQWMWVYWTEPCSKEEAMERLTKRGELESVIVCEKDCGGCEEYNKDLCSAQEKVYNRLAAYEDTGLKPEEIVALANDKLESADFDVGTDMFKLAICKAFEENYGASLEHVCELLKAESDGRLVVLPCKVGDTVYVLMQRNATTEVVKGTVRNVRRYSDDTWWVEFSDLWVDKTFDDFGKTVFLTQTEAEVALKGGREE